MTIYRSPNPASECCFCSRFKKFLIDNKLVSNTLVIIGDYNFLYIDWVKYRIVKGNSCFLKFLKLCLGNSLQQLVRDATRMGVILDLVLVNNSHLIDLFPFCHLFITLTIIQLE